MILKTCWSKGSNEITDIKVTQTTKERFVELFYVFSKRLNALIADEPQSPPNLG